MRMTATASVDPRQERGLALAKGKAKAFRHIAGDVFFVPSATNAGSGYVVDVRAGNCSCPDFEERGLVCKHQHAVRYFRHEAEMPDGTTVVTEGIRISYPQRWSAYNAAQCEEKDRVQILLRGLCDGIEQPAQRMGRPRLPLGDAVFGAAMKVYGTMSGRRSTSDLRASEAAGHMDRAPAFNTVSKYLEKPELAPLLRRLVDESARPLAAVERKFAVDATGFATQTYVRWYDYKHGEDRRVQRWVKLHAMVGTTTNVITSAEVTDGSANDSPHFAGLVERTAANGFTIDEVSADKAYLSHANLAAVERVGAMPLVPFKANSGSAGSAAWERMYHHFAANRDDFLARYHQRSNVESTFSAMKRKFGAGLRSKTQTAQFNEALLKCVCFNLSMVVHAIHDLGIDPKFWLPREVMS
jgi:transposase